MATREESRQNIQRMADDLLWREEKDLRPRTFEDVKDAPYAWPGERVFAATEMEHRAYNDDNRTPMSTRERDELQRHRFVTGALRRTICAPPTVIDNGFHEPFELKRSPRWCGGDCKECRRGETIPNMLRSNWDDEWNATVNREQLRAAYRKDVAMALLGKVNEVLNHWGYTLVCADSLRDVKSCDGSNCRAFVSIPLDEFNRLTGNIWD